MALLDFGSHDHDDRLDSSAGRFPARHVGKECADGRRWPDYRRLFLHPLCLRANVHCGGCSAGHAGGRSEDAC